MELSYHSLQQHSSKSTINDSILVAIYNLYVSRRRKVQGGSYTWLHDFIVQDKKMTFCFGKVNHRNLNTQHLLHIWGSKKGLSTRLSLADTKEITWKGHTTSVPKRSACTAEAPMEQIEFFSPCEFRYASVSLGREYPLNTEIEGSYIWTVENKFNISKHAISE